MTVYPRLLVSVRNAAETAAALAGGADLIDVKEPDRGSLGAADARQIAEVVRHVAGRVPVSVALGELTDVVGQPLPDLTGVTYAKLGLAGCAIRSGIRQNSGADRSRIRQNSEADDWRLRCSGNPKSSEATVESPHWTTGWRNKLAEFPFLVKPVAVIYADWQTAQAPPPEEVLAAASAAGVDTLLIDTFDKAHGDLLAHRNLQHLAALAAAARTRRMQLVLAGSLTLATIKQVLPLAPDYVAVRGAACRGDRRGTIDVARVSLLAETVHVPLVAQRSLEHRVPTMRNE
jgi:uncharacterized protein (UPF0264 family)